MNSTINQFFVFVIGLCCIISIFGCEPSSTKDVQTGESGFDIELTIDSDDNYDKAIESQKGQDIIEKAVGSEEDLTPPANDPIVYEMIEKQDKINSLEFYYSDYDTLQEVQDNNIEHIKMAGNKVLIDYQRLQNQDGYDYNAVYINHDLEEAFFMCNIKSCKPQNTVKKTEYLDVKDTPNPLDVLKLMRNSYFLMEQKYDSKECFLLIENGDDYTDKIFVWKFYGIPVHVERTYENRTVRMNYEDMAVNSLKESDVKISEDAVYVE
jgi:hypothetical protein